MPKIFSSLSKKFRGLSLIWKIIIIMVLILLGGGYLLFRPKTPVYQFVAVTRKSITETVSVTGNTTPIGSVSLGFGNSGTIARVYSDVGKNVTAGKVLAELDTGDLYAQLAQAQANADREQAKLAGLEAGSRPEDIAASQASLDKAKQDLANMYASIADSSTASYAKGNDAVRVQLSQFFSNGETGNPTLTYTTADSQAKIEAETERKSAKEALDKWQAELSAINQSNPELETLIKDSLSYLSVIHGLLDSVSKTLELATGLDTTTLTTYKANLTTALNEVNTASANMNTASQDIASQKLTVAELQAELDLKKAGSTQDDIEAQKAQAESAQAGVQSIAAKLQNSRIIAPIAGVITRFDAKVGEFATAGTSLISIISANSFEVDALVSETDIGKVALGNKVEMILDAFPNETFGGSIFYIDPAQTTSEGAVGYKIKIAFDTANSRMKSGLTANIDIETRHKDNVLTLPQYAILQNDQGTFVQVLENKKVTDVPVVLGIQDQSGNVEIISGVTEGEQVLNIGLKPK